MSQPFSDAADVTEPVRLLLLVTELGRPETRPCKETAEEAAVVP